MNTDKNIAWSSNSKKDIKEQALKSTFESDLLKLSCLFDWLPKQVANTPNNFVFRLANQGTSHGI